MTVLKCVVGELRQPLETIESIAFYLEMVLPRAQGKARRQVDALQQQVRRIQWVLADGMRLVDAAPLRPQLLDLAEVASRASREWKLLDGPEIRLELEDDVPPVMIDLRQFEHLLRNLIAVFRRLSAPHATIAIRIYAEAGGTAALAVRSNALEPGSELSETFACSEVLELASMRKIAEAHGARMEVQQRETEAAVVLALPAA